MQAPIKAEKQQKNLSIKNVLAAVTNVDEKL